MAKESSILRLGTRGSLLARTQSGLVAEELQKRHPGLKVELVIIKTTGDQVQDKPLRDAGGKGLFTKELELALLAGQVDFAVHSFKDVPVTEPLVDQADLIIAAVPPREDPRDVMASHKSNRLVDLPKGAKVGTGSMRRACQILTLRPDVKIEGVRGNIDTRLRKLKEGQFDAVILAMAGLRRTNLFDPTFMSAIEPEEMLPAAGQGALAIQCRKSDLITRRFLEVLNDPATAQCVQAERDLVMALQGDCHSPIAALAVMKDGKIELRAAVGGKDGYPPVLQADAMGDQKSVVQQIYQSLVQQGVIELLGHRS